MVGPIASNDAAIVEANHSLVIPVLVNDGEPDEQARPVVLLTCTQPMLGTAAVNGDTIVYESTNSMAGVDAMTYTVRNRFGSTASATVTVVVAADVTSPVLLSAVYAGDLSKVIVTFNERVQLGAGTNGAENAVNYQIDHGVSVDAAQWLADDGRRVLLTTSPMGPGTNYTLTVNNVGDLAQPPNPIAADSRAMFSPMASSRMWIGLNGYTDGEVLTNFPVLVVLGTHRSGFAYTQFASANGWDLRFKASDGETELPYEIEEWNTNGNSYIWVRVPTLTSNTWMTAWWGDTNKATQPAYTTNGILWVNGYRGVWHFSESSGTTVCDSTSNRTAGTLSGGVTVHALGAIAGGDRYDGTNGLATMGNENLFDFGSNAFCVSFWIKNSRFMPAKNEWTIVSKGAYNQPWGWELEVSTWAMPPNVSTWILKPEWPGYAAAPGTSILVPSNTWHHVALVRSGNVMSCYCDGALNSCGTNTAYGADFQNAYPLRIAQPIFASCGFSGSIDELRLVGTGRSAAWVRAEYLNVVSNGMATGYGPAVSLYMTPWEEWRFAHFTASQLADPGISGDVADPDLDGMKNNDEYLAGTNPTDPASCLVLPSAGVNPEIPGQFLVSWESVSNRVYALQATTNLADGFDVDLGTNIPATPAVNVYTDDMVNAVRKFYRVKVVE